MSNMNKSIDTKGLSYHTASTTRWSMDARTIAADIEKILKSEDPKPTKEDIKVLQLLAKKIAAKDWASEAQVSSDDFLGCDMER